MLLYVSRIFFGLFLLLSELEILLGDELFEALDLSLRQSDAFVVELATDF